MRTQAIVKYKLSNPVEYAEMVGTSQRARVDFDRLLHNGAVILDHWWAGGWRVFHISNPEGLDVTLKDSNIGKPDTTREMIPQD